MRDQARSWVLKAKDGGYEALVDNRGHHKDKSELTELDKANLRIRQLETELKDKELVEHFAKKLLELQRKGRLAYIAIKEVSQGKRGALTKLLAVIGVCRQAYYKGLKREETAWETRAIVNSRSEHNTGLISIIKAPALEFL